MRIVPLWMVGSLAPMGLLEGSPGEFLSTPASSSPAPIGAGGNHNTKRTTKREAHELIVASLALSVGWFVLSTAWVALPPVSVPQFFPFTWIPFLGAGPTEYADAFAIRGYDFVADLARASDADLRDDVGIPFPAHRKRIVALANSALLRWSWSYLFAVLCLIGGFILTLVAAGAVLVLLLAPEIRARVVNTVTVAGITGWAYANILYRRWQEKRQGLEGAASPGGSASGARAARGARAGTGAGSSSARSSPAVSTPPSYSTNRPPPSPVTPSYAARGGGQASASSPRPGQPGSPDPVMENAMRALEAKESSKKRGVGSKVKKMFGMTPTRGPVSPGTRTPPPETHLSPDAERGMRTVAFNPAFDG